MGHQVALILRPTSKLNRLHGTEKKFEICRGTTDIEITDFVAIFQPEVVVHAACAYGRQGETSLQLFDANQRFGIGILQALHHVGKPVCFINTGSALAPEVSPYSLSKYQFAQWGRMLAEQSFGKLQFINVLLQHMYGPGDDVSKFTTHVLHACMRNESELELTAGDQIRDFIYVEDVISAYDTLLINRRHLKEAQEVEVGSGVASTIREFVDTVHRLTNSHTKLHFGALPYRVNEVMHSVANNEQMNTLGWVPANVLSVGLKKTIELESKL